MAEYAPVDPTDIARLNLRPVSEYEARRFCPRCDSWKADRRSLPIYLVPLRLIPFTRVRAFTCHDCSKRFVKWTRRSRGA